MTNSLRFKRKDSQLQRGARGNSFESVLHKEIAKLVSSIRFLSVFQDRISLQFSWRPPPTRDALE